MKHFFYAYDEQECKNGILNRLFENNFIAQTDMDECLKILYDAADIIRDIRFERDDTELSNVLNKISSKMATDSITVQEKLRSAEQTKDVDDPNKIETTSKEKKQYRIDALKCMWLYVEQRYKEFETSNHHLFHEASEKMQEQYKISVSRILYHLVRGNICLRISQCYFENYNLRNSEFWGNRAMEIFWHGKQVAGDLRNSTTCQDKSQADLYLRLIKLNLAKCYRDYARKNRRSDFDAALDEFKWTRHRVEEQIKHASNDAMKRQYVLIWMDAVFNIAYIHRQRYRAAEAEKEMLFFYRCLSDQLRKEDPAFHRDEQENSSFPKLIDKADKLMSPFEDDECQKIFEIDLPALSKKSFELCDYLNDYDRRRYFLLILLEFGRIFRALHCVDNYARSAASSVVADQWSYLMDRRTSPDVSQLSVYEPGHNLDALIIFSNSLRKYIKFGEVDGCKFATSLNICIDNNDYEFSLRNDQGTEIKKAGLNMLIRKLVGFADNGHLSSKEEMIKWYCFYLQNPQNLKIIKNTFRNINIIKEYLQEKKPNHQLLFLKGLVYIRSGKYKKAIKIFKKLTAPEIKATQYIRFATIGLKARYLLATCYMALAEYSKAEKLLETLKDTLEKAQKKRDYRMGLKNQSVELESSDMEPDGRIEIDLGYCYMQKGEYQKAIELYKKLYGDGGDREIPEFNLPQMKKQHRIMGLNNYAACCILSADDESKTLTFEEKMEIARKIFFYLDADSNKAPHEEKYRNRNDPETNLLKGYYTICTGADPEEEPTTEKPEKEYNESIATSDSLNKSLLACIKAHKYFRNACRASEGYSIRYDLMDKGGVGDYGKYRNEVERISAYLINLIKLNRITADINENGDEQNIQNIKLHLTEIQKKYLGHSKKNLERLLLSFPKEYQISLKAAIAMAEWLLLLEQSEGTNRDAFIKQLYRSFSYLTIYEERGAKVFNNLKDNRKFRLFTADQRGKLLALLLSMYSPIKTIKEECCFTITDRNRVPYLVHYTSMGTLKSMLNAKHPRFRINNCGYMNDVFEGTVFLKIINHVAQESKNSNKKDFVEKYFPQLSRSHEDRIPAASNVYIGSLSVKEDSFHMWSVYADKETGCNFEFGKNFFDIKGIPYHPKALRDYLISRYTDEDYPLYIVQYIDKEFGAQNLDTEIGKSVTSDSEEIEKREGKGRIQTCGTEAIYHPALLQLLKQIYERWKRLDDYLSKIFNNPYDGRNNAIYEFTADRINEIRFLFKDVNYEFEGEVRVVYTDSTDGNKSKTDASMNVPRVYVNLERKLEGLTVRLGSRIEDATIDKYVTWLKHTKRVSQVGLAKQNRYTI